MYFNQTNLEFKFLPAPLNFSRVRLDFLFNAKRRFSIQERRGACFLKPNYEDFTQGEGDNDPSTLNREGGH